jgi:hypothetical protein
MDESPAPSQTLQLVVEINRTSDTRLQGRVRPDSSEVWTLFSGVLELLKVLEDLVEDDSSELPALENAPNSEKETT